MNALAVATVDEMETAAQRHAAVRPVKPLDAESRRWLDELHRPGPARDEALERLHALLLRAARFEVARRRPGLPHLRGDELEEIATEAADDALMNVLKRLDDFRGLSRFTTWAYKFALLEAGVRSWALFSSSGPTPENEAEQREFLSTLQRAIDELLTPHQRKVLIALAVNGVPIDVLAERLDSTRGALYKTLHDARGKLRRHLAAEGLMTVMTGERGEA